jgi:hypothetical protein
MRRYLAILLFLIGCDGGPPVVEPDAGPFADYDEDTITDFDELSDFERDTDGDGTPDYRDDDSDNDGFSDAFEAGDDDLSTRPRDTDGDMLEDYRDEDSDDNGIPDERDGDGDVDGDSIPDFIDFDDDGDTVSDVDELAGRTDFPQDSDGDGAPNFRDNDSDNDTISDREEWGVDTDRDGVDDWADDDSDADTISDADEAGDDDVDTAPIDTDEDGIPDFQDRDSDNDGLPDDNEVEAGTDPLDEDSDDDGVSDLIEVGAGTDPNDDTENPRTRGDFVFVMPYLEAPEPAEDTLLFRTNIQFADIYFLFDTTGSMGPEIAAMKEAVEDVITTLTCASSGAPCSGDLECDEDQVCSATGECISDPRLSGCIANMWTGVGAYAGATDTYRNLLSLQGDSAETSRRIPGSANGTGGSESLFESVACVADPLACSGAMCTPGGVGCPSYREEAVRILVTITDEPNQCTNCTPNTAAAAGIELRDEDIVFVGVDAHESGSPETHLKAIARASNSLDARGDPLYLQGNGDAVTDAVTEAIQNIARNVPVFVSVEAEEVDGDDGDALQFIDQIVVNTSGEEECTMVRSTADTDGDGEDDAFPSLLPGTPVCWDVIARENDRVAPTDRPQVFRARLVVRGDGSILDARTIYFLVPPNIDIPIFG